MRDKLKVVNLTATISSVLGFCGMDYPSNRIEILVVGWVTTSQLLKSADNIGVKYCLVQISTVRHAQYLDV